MSDTYLICGAGGFIGGHLVKNLLQEGNNVVAVDNKPFEYWFQYFDESKNYSLDIKEYENCIKVSEGIDYIYNMACNMGGMGFIENNKAECMLSVLINTNLLRACLKFFRVLLELRDRSSEFAIQQNPFLDIQR